MNIEISPVGVGPRWPRLDADLYVPAPLQAVFGLGVVSSPGGVVKIDLPVVTAAKVASKIEAAKAGMEGVRVADTLSTDVGSVFGWFLEAAQSGDFAKASAAFRSAAEIVDRMTGIEGT